MTDEYLIVGQIGSTYGVKGWLKILSFTEVARDILNYHTWYIEENRSWKALEVLEGREHGKGVVVKLKGLDNPEQARLLSGRKFAVLRKELPVLPPNEYYWDELKGLTVINQRGEILGKVSDIIATGANDVLIVKDKKEHAVPYLPGKVIKQVDLKKGEIHVEWEVI